MHIIKKNSFLNNLNSDIKTFNLNSDGLDGIFAELFSSVNFSSLETVGVENDSGIKESINKDHSQNELNAAKSLVSIFFDTYNFNAKTKNGNEKIEMLLNSDKATSNVMNLNVNEISQKFLSKNNIDPIFPNEEKKNILLLNKTVGKNSDKKVFVNATTKAGINNIEFSETDKNKSFDLHKLSQDGKTNLYLNQSKHDFVTDGKSQVTNMFKKKVNRLKSLDLETKFSDIESNSSKSELIYRINSNNAPQKKNILEKIYNQNINNSQLNDNISKDSKELDLKLTSQRTNIADQKYLDLMESGWGEKFSKTLKLSIQRGVQKIDFNLEPKNLGKLKVEIKQDEGKTSVKISTDNKNVANILNENQSKLTELLDKEQLRFDESNYMSFGKNFSNKQNKEGSDKSNRDESSHQVKKSSSEKKIMTNYLKKNEHKVDIKA